VCAARTRCTTCCGTACSPTCAPLAASDHRYLHHHLIDSSSSSSTIIIRIISISIIIISPPIPCTLLPPRRSLRKPRPGHLMTLGPCRQFTTWFDVTRHSTAEGTEYVVKMAVPGEADAAGVRDGCHAIRRRGAPAWEWEGGGQCSCAKALL
jgi:hypothetical protein